MPDALRGRSRSLTGGIEFRRWLRGDVTYHPTAHRFSGGWCVQFWFGWIAYDPQGRCVTDV